MSRSVRASQAGIQAAKQALARKSLSQKALATDLHIASWSTINKFFTGKPIDRFLFIEICNTLDLNWQDIIENPTGVKENNEETPSPPHLPIPPTPYLSILRQQSAAAREALTPRILERIPRAVVQEKYRFAIDRSLSAEQPQVIPIIAPAGYGKSTILGDLYDQLTQAGTPWVGIILCSTVSVASNYFSFLSSTYLAATFLPAGATQISATPPVSYQLSAVDGAFGSSLSGLSQPLTALTQALTETVGRGVLLIDTLDLLLNRDLVPVLNALLRQLLDQGVTVVLTCRDHEYSDYLEPTRERLTGIAQRVNRYTVPDFTTAEIRLAAETFFRKLEPDAPERGQAFADRILSLSADNRSLREIIQNPLLLALLCDLFAQDGNVPPDLTVSKLYQRYWNEKIAYSRVESSDTKQIALQKEAFCLTMANTIFSVSHDKLHESIYRDELNIEFTELVTSAYNDLLSEGVLELLPSRKLHFFHQTLLEYAIAYWLTRYTAQPQRAQLLDWMRQPDASQTRTHWLPILRQYLTIIDEAEFELLFTQLNWKDLGIFGVTAYAAASRDRSDALRRLLPVALAQGEAHQRRLRQALSAAPRSLIKSTWDILLLLLTQADHATAGNTAQMAGSLLAEWWQTLKGCLPQSLTAIAQRQPHAVYPDERAMLSGWLLHPCLPLLEQSPDPNLLASLRQHLPQLGYRTCASVIQLHTHSTVPVAAQYALLHQLLPNAIPDQDPVKQALINFLAALLPPVSHHFPLGQSWSEILYCILPERWDVVQSKSVGRWAVKDEIVLTGLLQDYGFADSRRIQQSFIAINECLAQGGGSKFTAALTQIDLSTLPVESLQRYSALLNRKNVCYLSTAEQEAIVCWLQPHIQQHIQTIYLAIDVLADASQTARQLMEQFMSVLPAKAQAAMRIRFLRFQPIEQHPPLTQLEKPAQRMLIQVYRQQATAQQAAFDRLIAIAQLPMKDIALAASFELEQVYPNLFPEQLLPLLQSDFPGVRANAINSLIALVTQPTFTASNLGAICQILSEEDNQNVARLLCKLVAVWVRHHSQPPVDILDALTPIPARLLSQNLFEGGTARALIDALKAIAQSEPPTVKGKDLAELVQQLLISIHLIQVRNSESEMIDLLCALNRLHPPSLNQLISQSCPLLARQSWLCNISVLIKTIRQVEGAHSPLFEQIRTSDWCTPAIESLILQAKGV